MSNIRFTVITVTYNAQQTIKKTIESVLKQTYAPFEYIIIDGMSTDQTVSMANEYVNSFTEKGIRYIISSEKDTGIYNAMNKGIAVATGDFISFLNSGDWYEEDALQSIQDLYLKENFDLVYGGIHYLSSSGSYIDKMSKMDKYWITSRHWNHPSMFLRREIYQKYRFDENYHVYADFELYVKLRKTAINIKIIDKVLTYFMTDGVSTNASIKNILARSKEKFHAYRKNGYSIFYWFEAYGWELIKAIYLKLRK